MLQHVSHASSVGGRSQPWETEKIRNATISTLVEENKVLRERLDAEKAAREAMQAGLADRDTYRAALLELQAAKLRDDGALEAARLEGEQLRRQVAAGEQALDAKLNQLEVSPSTAREGETPATQPSGTVARSAPRQAVSGSVRCCGRSCASASMTRSGGTTSSRPEPCPPPRVNKTTHRHVSKLPAATAVGHVMSHGR